MAAISVFCFSCKKINTGLHAIGRKDECQFCKADLHVCKNCELSEKFVNLMLSPEGQKILMEKNYMFPVLKGIRENTAFGKVQNVETLPFEVMPEKEIDRWLKTWTELRRAESN